LQKKGTNKKKATVGQASRTIKKSSCQDDDKKRSRRPISTRKNFVMKFIIIIVLMLFWLWMDGSRHLYGVLFLWWFSVVCPKTFGPICSLKSFVIWDSCGSYDETMILVAIYFDMAFFLNVRIISGLRYFNPSGYFIGSLIFSGNTLSLWIVTT
jgi:hypothetical protein